MSLLVAQECVELPLRWSPAARDAMVAVVEQAAGGGDGTLPIEGELLTLPAPEGHTLFFGPVENDVALYGLRPAVDAPFSGLSNEQLAKLGVDSHLSRAVQTAEDIDEVESLGLDATVLMRLKTHLRSTERPEDLLVVPELLKYRVPDLQTLSRYYRGELKALLLNLVPRQERLVDIDAKGPILVNGVAGSGKTTVALYRAHRLANQVPGASPRILFLAFNRSLVQVARELLTDICEGQLTNIEVKTLHAWCIAYLQKRRGQVRIAHRFAIANYMTDAVREVRESGVASRLFDREREFWRDEISQVVKGRCQADKARYMEVVREGRGSGLGPKPRAVVWSVFEAYQRLLASDRRLDFDDVILEALSELEADEAFEPYDHLLMDEAQDLLPVALQLCSRLVPPEAPRMFVLADATQSIYQHGFKWKDVGLTISGRVYRLDRNFRSTIEILEAAAGLVRNSKLAADPDVAEATQCHRHGPKPRLVECRSQNAETTFVANHIAQHVREGAVLPGNVVVLARDLASLKQVGDTLEGLGVECRKYDEGELVLGDPSVKLVSLHSAKGLEFPWVYIISVNRGSLPKALANLSPEDRDEHHLRERKLLYVGMTRAMQELVLTCTRDRPSPFLAELDPEALERSDGGRPAPRLDSGVVKMPRELLTVQPGDQIEIRVRGWVDVTKVEGRKITYSHGPRGAQCTTAMILRIRRGDHEIELEG